MKRTTVWLGMVLSLCLVALPAARAAETSQVVPFVGCDGGLTGTVDVRVRLYTAAAGGAMVFEETHPGLDGSSTCVSLQIGNMTDGGIPPAVFVANPSLWVAFALNDTPDTELGGSRTPIMGNGYAFRAEQANNATQLGGMPASGYLQTTGGTLSGSSDTPVVSVTNTGGGSALTALSQSTQGVAGLFRNTAGGDLLQGKSASDATVFRLFNNGGAFFDGNVGIGTATPGSKLHMRGVTSAFVPFAGLAIDQVIPPSLVTHPNSYLFRVRSLYPFSETTDFLINGEGNVGIGIATPEAKLHIAGSLRAVRNSSNDITVQTTGGTNAWAQMRFKTPSQEWLMGSSRDFNGNQFYLADLTYNQSRMMIQPNGGAIAFPLGNVGIGTTSPTAKLDVAGTVKAQVVQITGADFSEKFEVRDTPGKIEPGMVVAIDSENPGKLVVSAQPYDRRVAGILSGAGGVRTGMLMGQPGTLADGDQPVALSGRVYVWADASNGPIAPGDLLTTSGVPGHAMRVSNHRKAQGAILGKAMTGLAKGRGLVLVLVTLQ